MRRNLLSIINYEDEYNKCKKIINDTNMCDCSEYNIWNKKIKKDFDYNANIDNLLATCKKYFFDRDICNCQK